MTTSDQLNAITETVSQMILAGVLLRNVTKHFTNLGVNEVLVQKLVRLAEIKANQFSSYKAN